MVATANQVLALLVLDIDAKRLAVKYVGASKSRFADVEAQKKFEKKVILKLPKPSVTGRATENDVALVDDLLVLYKMCNDVYVCVVCNETENELTISQLLEGMYQAISASCQTGFVSTSVTKTSILECLDQVLLVLDEVTDGGIILESDEEKIGNRIRMIEEVEGGRDESAPEAVLKQATQAAKKRLLDSLLGART